MSLKPQPFSDLVIPEETVRAARAAFPRGNRYLRLRDTLGPLFRDEDFAALYSHRGQPAYSPWRLALVTVMQYMENLSDRHAAEAVRARLDWKYVLGDAGFDASALSEFKGRLTSNGTETLLLDALLERLQVAGLVKGRVTTALTLNTWRRASASSVVWSWWERSCAQRSTSWPPSRPPGSALVPV